MTNADPRRWPCAGKTTLAHQLAAQYDAAVADFDAIAVSLGSPTSHDHPAHIADQAGAEYQHVLTTPRNLVAIRCAPTQAERYAVARRMHADEVIVLAVDATTCKNRAIRADRAAHVLADIDRWWNRYQATNRDVIMINTDDDDHEASRP